MSISKVRRSYWHQDDIDWTHLRNSNNGKGAWVSQAHDGSWTVHLPAVTLASREDAEREAERLLTGAGSA